MSMPKDEIQKEMEDAWRTFMDGMEKSLDLLDRQIIEARDMTSICTSEWCEATEHYIDELGNALFSISEPRWSNEADHKRLKDLKRRVHEMYANYRDVYEKAGRS